MRAVVRLWPCALASLVGLALMSYLPGNDALGEAKPLHWQHVPFLVFGLAFALGGFFLFALGVHLAIEVKVRWVPAPCMLACWHWLTSSMP